MLVKEIMIKNVVTIDVNASVFDACMTYKNKKVGCIVVVENDTCVGIITERDLIERSICARKDPEKTKVAEIMSQDIKVVSTLDTTDAALELMKQYKIKKLPVVSDEKVVGIITITDIAEARPEISKRFMETWMKTQWRD
jgi:CBS domain-containing protein